MLLSLDLDKLDLAYQLQELSSPESLIAETQ